MSDMSVFVHKFLLSDVDVRRPRSNLKRARGMNNLNKITKWSGNLGNCIGMVSVFCFFLLFRETLINVLIPGSATSNPLCS